MPIKPWKESGLATTSRKKYQKAYGRLRRQSKALGKYFRGNFKLRRYRSIALKPHTFMRQTVQSLTLPGTWTAYNGVGGTASGYLATNIEYAFSDIPGYTEFTAMFEKYRIDKIVVEFSMPQTVAGGEFDTSGTSAQAAQMMLVTLPSTDVNRITVKKNLDDVLQMNKPKHRAIINPKSKPVTVIFKPNILIQTYETAALTGYEDKYSPWLYVEEPTHTHYGLSVGIYRVDGAIMAGPGNVPMPKLMVRTKYYFTCKTLN